MKKAYRDMTPQERTTARIEANRSIAAEVSVINRVAAPIKARRAAVKMAKVFGQFFDALPVSEQRPLAAAIMSIRRVSMR